MLINQIRVIVYRKSILRAHRDEIFYLIFNFVIKITLRQIILVTGFDLFRFRINCVGQLLPSVLFCSGILNIIK